MDCFRVKSFGSNVTSSASVTVTQENCENIENIFNYLFYDCKIESIKAILVRDEGIYKTPESERKKIFKAYTWLVDKISEFTESGLIKNHNKESLQGKLHQ